MVRVFVSWSGPYSGKVAALLKEWLPDVIQEVDAYFSDTDIETGERWSQNISKELEETDIGILVLTKSNMSAPWILFEAGALSKKGTSRVAPLLCDLQILDI